MTEIQLADLRDALHLAQLFAERSDLSRTIALLILARQTIGDLPPADAAPDETRGAGGTL